eukprot:14728919-Alexandrium_andersonii.AAC.1
MPSPRGAAGTAGRSPSRGTCQWSLRSTDPTGGKAFCCRCPGGCSQPSPARAPPWREGRPRTSGGRGSSCE